jgi:hypothetical protein
MRINLTHSAVVTLAVFVVLAMAVLSHAAATDIIYLDRSLFNAQVSGQATIDFTSTDANTTVKGTSYPYLTTGGTVTFAGQNGRSVEVFAGNTGLMDPNEVVLATTCLGNSCVMQPLQPDLLTLMLPAGTQAIGFDLKDTNNGLLGGPEDTYQITDSNMSTITITPTSFASFQFVGFGVAPGGNADITFITIKRLTFSPNGEAAIDMVSFSPNAPTPEPSTLSLTGAGLFATGSFLRRRLGRRKK